MERKKVAQYERTCPQCGKTIYYTEKWVLNRANKNNYKCKTCIAKENGLKSDGSKNFILSDEQQKELCDLYLIGYRTVDLAFDFGIDQLTVQRYLHRNNIEIRDHNNECKKWADSVERNNYYNTIYIKEYNHKNKKVIKGKNLKKKYGMSYDDFETMLENQNFRCSICNEAFTENKPPVVDHCHVSGKVRELVHSVCNTLLGMANDDIEVLQNAIEYLKRHKE